MARLTPAFQNSFFSDLRAAQAAVQGGHVFCKIIPRSIVTRCPSATKFRRNTCFRTHRTLLSSSFKCLVTGSVTDTSPHRCLVSGPTRLLRRVVLFPRLTSWKTVGTLGRRLVPIAGNLTNASTACSVTMGSRTPPTHTV